MWGVITAGRKRRREGRGHSGPAEAPEGPQSAERLQLYREGKHEKTPRARNPSCAWSRGRDIATVAPALRKHLQSGRLPSTLRRFSASERPLSPNPSGCHTFFSTSLLLSLDRVRAFRPPPERQSLRFLPLSAALPSSFLTAITLPVRPFDSACQPEP